MAGDDRDDERREGEPNSGEQLSDDIARKYDPERLLTLVSKRAGRGAPLEHDVRQKLEKRWGTDLGHVRVITGEFAEEFNKQRGAHAVTVGSTGMILMRGGADRAMHTRQGRALLAHEVTHVAQKKPGLWNRATAPLASEFSAQEEAEAHHEEERVGGGGSLEGGDTNAAANEMKAEKDAEKDMKEALEKIRERVFEMATDAQRLDWLRNAIGRRP